MRKLLLSLFAFIAVGGAAWADGPDVTGKTFTLTAGNDYAQDGTPRPRGSVYFTGTQLSGGGSEENATKFAIIEYGGNTYLYDADHSAFVINELSASQVNSINNKCLESSTDFSMIVKGVQFVAGSSDDTWMLKDENGYYLNTSGSNVFMNSWTAKDAGNCYTVNIAETEFNNAEAIALLDSYFSVNVTYNIVDTKGQTVFTSEKIVAEVGDVITELPNEYKRAFCTYEVQSTTVQQGDNVVTVTVTYNIPFEISEDYASATWYTMNIRGTKDVSMGSTEPYSLAAATLETKLLNDEYHWAFIGNPYEFAVINKAAGEGSTLTKAGDNAVMRSGDYRWTLCQNSDGFTLKETGTATNYVNDNNSTLKFWNNASAAADNGSTFRVTAVPDDVYAALLEEQIKEAKNTLQTIGNVGTPGHLTAEAKTVFEAAIQEAEAATSDNQTAYNNLKAATATAKTSISYVPRTDVYYTITNAVWNGDGSRGSMIYNPNVTHKDATNDNADYIWSTSNVGRLTRNVEGETNEDGTQKTEQYWAYGETPLDDQNPDHLWGFIQGEDGSYYMYNVGKKQFASIGQGHPDANYGKVWIFSETPSIITMNDGDTHLYTAPNVRIQATIPSSTNATYNMSMSTGYIGPFITYYDNNDGGVPMLFAESSYPINDEVTAHIKSLIESVTPYRDALQAVIDNAPSIAIGDGLGEYTDGGLGYTDALAAAKAEVDKEEATKETLTSAREALEAAIEALTLNLPEAGTFLRLTGMSGNAISEGIATNDNKTFTMSDADDATTIFYFDGQHLINLSTGKANAMSSSQWAWVYGTDNASVVTFREGDERGKYYVGSGVGCHAFGNLQCNGAPQCGEA